MNMPDFYIRSTLFNLCFYALTGLACIFLLPTLFLPRQAFLFVVHGFVTTADFLAKHILGLTYEVRGQENLPVSGSYIVASKHQSAYETLKLHILFNDPAVVLKKELLKIPLWGKYLDKSDVIAIDRSTPKSAIKSIQDGARDMAARGRPMVIFPQGTRVGPEQTSKDKPYKIGIVRMQEATNLPIIPMALNTGIFWPRNSWYKKPGKVIFEFLPSVEVGEDATKTLKQIESVLEQKSNELMEEGRKSIPKPKPKPLRLILGGAAFVFLLAYSINWFIIAGESRKIVGAYLNHMKQDPMITVTGNVTPRTSGFPGKIKVFLGPHTLHTPQGSFSVDSLQAKGWPFPNMPIQIEGEKVTLSMPNWTEPLEFNRLDASIIMKGDLLTITESHLKKEGFQSMVSGDIDFSQEPYPGVDLNIKLKEHEILLTEMIEKRIVKENPAMIASMALQSLKKDGVVHVTFKKHDDGLYLGPIKVVHLPSRARGDVAYQARQKIVP
jgi:1-acyl-sn-glycerol-3-phosphate acyltransferase